MPPAPNSLKTLLTWFAPFWFGPTRICRECGTEFPKEQAVRVHILGSFCSENHADEFRLFMNAY